MAKRYGFRRDVCEMIAIDRDRRARSLHLRLALRSHSHARMGARLIVLGALVGLVGCADVEVARDRAPIVNGSESADGAHPSTVFLWLGGGSCSGTLVTPRVVVTAKHCLQGTSLGSLGVFFGNDSDGEGTWVDVAHYQNHSSGDIAILTMVEPGPVAPTPISAVALGNEHLGIDTLLVGFGDTGGAGGAGVKREGWTTLESVDGDIMYVGSSGSKTCYGDSGGPTFIDWDGVRHVAGVSSFITESNCNYGSSGNVRTDYYYDWLTAYIAEHDPASCAADGQCATGCPDVDPDCPCAADGICTDLCADYVTADPDCAGCGAGDLCREDCPALDTDCCAEDGVCNDACGEALDVDCAPPPDDDPPPDDGDPGIGGDPDDVVSGGCQVGGGGPAWAALALLGIVGLRRKRSLR